jgi:PAS domain S-box-containing protein
MYRLDVRPVQEPAALLVVNHKGAISHASASLGALLGYSSKALAKMQLEDIIPVPYAQLHKSWVKVGEGLRDSMRIAAPQECSFFRHHGVACHACLWCSTLPCIV